MIFIKYLTILMTTGLLSLSFMSTSSAHSYVEDSDPAEDATVEEEVDTLTLNFDAGIESATTATVVDDEGEEYEIAEESVESPEYSATLTEPLPSGDYIIEWEALGDDGHTTEGEVAFSVAVDEDATEDEAIEQETNEEETTTTEDDSAQEEETAAGETTEDDGAGWIITASLALIIIGALIFFISRRNKA
ncbi:copper resistance CopC family protein [Natribacillus halophilus]|uniref:CopC domain-containing protein n=1 Tax=Natribacillus halophilus TaxID=549003 RepID=A0A1G8P8E5_9BACI|nr:copper resistance protein CopC [Natribacillus halophilus]SDI88732.1 hypothetical protein SAMN04488123_1084 [Natribacillus halophilus]